MADVAGQIARLSPEKRELLLRRLKERSAVGPRDEIPVQPRSALAFPVSYAQERLWFLDQLSPHNPFYNIPLALRLSMPLNVGVLEGALNELVARHEALRTTFAAVSGQPVQVVAPSLVLSVQTVDLRAHGASMRESEAVRLATEEAQQPFDLAAGPLIRARLLRLGDADYVFLLTLHHIVADGWSMQILARELTALYTAFATGRPSPLARLRVQYADFSVWQRQWLQGAVLDRQTAYWREKLAGLPALALPTDRPRPAVQTFRGAYEPLALSPRASGALRALSQQDDVTLFMVLLAAFKVLLHRYSGQDDIVVGTYIANRTRSELEPVVGFFVNTLVLRTDVSGNPSFRELLARVRRVALDAYANQDLPFEKLVAELQPERDLSRNPLCQVTFQIFESPLPAAGDAADPAPQMVDIQRGSAIFDIAFGMYETPQGLAGGMEYSADLFDAATMRRMTQHFVLLVENLVANPDERIGNVTLLSDAEREQLLLGWNATESEYPQASIHALFDAQAERTPDATALIEGDARITYRELRRRANDLAWWLGQRGLGRQAPVGIFMERSIDLVAAMLGVLKAGACYVPLDPGYPAKRIAYMLEDAAVPVLLTQRRLVERLPNHDALVMCVDEEQAEAAEERDADPGSEVRPDDVAYVIYTSGSTGTPKGVLGLHRATVNRLHWMWRAFPFAQGEVCCHKTAINFVDSVSEIFGPLLQGCCSVVVSDDTAKDPNALIGLLAAHKVTRIVLVPSLLRALLDTEPALCERLPSLELWVSSGEALASDLCAEFRQRMPGRVLLNLYGSSEVAADATWYDTRQESAAVSVPIGRPIANTRIYLLDRFLQSVPVGVAGELHVGGAGLARGYLNRPELTAEKFIRDPFSDDPSARLYKTGDLARYLPDGNIEFLGRVDRQVKLRGFRVELGEIENTLRDHPGVEDAAVITRERSTGDVQLLAYLVQDPQYQGPAAAEQAHWTEDQLPRWQMVWDETYQQAPEPADPTFNVFGWNSSYTGLPIAAEEMREWVDWTVESVLRWKPRRVLEIGCGTGLLLFRIAPHCTSYHATDFAATALDYVRQRLSAAGERLSHVELQQRDADDFGGFEPQMFDAVILNSVVQYFPSVDYLLAVLRGVLPLVAPGGIVFIGDVRNLQLLEAFHLSVELQRAAAALPADQLQDRFRKRVAEERELVIDPALFHALQAQFPQIADVQIRPKRGRYHNELTRFRYDVTLRLAPGNGARPPLAIDWTRDGLTLANLRQRLLERDGAAYRVSGIPNARLAGEIGVLERANAAHGSMTAGELREARRALEANGIDPEELVATMRDSPFWVDLRLSESSGCVDALFARSEADLRELAPSAGAARVKPWSDYVNNPLQGMFAHTLVPELRRFLESRLPPYMVPARFVLLDRLPLLPNGKINRLALPEPDRNLPRRERAYVAPTTDLERVLADIWAEVLNIVQVGKRDNFFAELGGHSLLGTQLIARVQSALRISVPLRRLFESPTVETFAAALRQDPVFGAQVERTAELLVKVAELSDAEAKTMLSQRTSTGGQEPPG